MPSVLLPENPPTYHICVHIAGLDADHGAKITSEMTSVNFKTMDFPRNVELENAPVIPLCALTTGLPTIHPFAINSEFSLIPNRLFTL